MPSHHPPIAQRKQRRQLHRVLGQSLVAKLGEAELELAVGDWGGDLKRALEKSTGAFQSTWLLTKSGTTSTGSKRVVGRLKQPLRREAWRREFVAIVLF